jgi:hypothetical protein
MSTKKKNNVVYDRELRYDNKITIPRMIPCPTHHRSGSVSLADSYQPSQFVQNLREAVGPSARMGFDTPQVAFVNTQMLAAGLVLRVRP